MNYYIVFVTNGSYEYFTKTNLFLTDNSSLDNIFTNYNSKIYALERQDYKIWIEEYERINPQPQNESNSNIICEYYDRKYQESIVFKQEKVKSYVQKYMPASLQDLIMSHIMSDVSYTDSLFFIETIKLIEGNFST